MPLDGTDVGVDRSQQGVEGDVANVLIAIQQETTEDVDCQDPETTFRSEEKEDNKLVGCEKCNKIVILGQR